jgi:XTP/dITP diphosphohydrolase
MHPFNELLVATRNRGKVRELEVLLAGLPLRLRSLDEFADAPEAEETAATFAGNAALKAAEYAAQTQLWTLADDSGLEVAALGGAPGVYSARYGGAGLTMPQRVQLLLQEMVAVPDAERRARFVCALAVANPAAEIVFQTAGYCPGRLLRETRGAGGFGYDPIFIPDGHDRTFAELPADVKNSISHRARALQKLRGQFINSLA